MQDLGCQLEGVLSWGALGGIWEGEDQSAYQRVLLDPMEWTIPNTLDRVEEMTLQNGNTNGENCWLNQPSQISCLPYCFTTRGRNDNTHSLTDRSKYAGPWASSSFMSSNPQDTLLDPSWRH